MIWYKPGYRVFMHGKADTILTAAIVDLIGTIFVNFPILLFTSYAATIVNANAPNQWRSQLKIMVPPCPI